MFQRNTKFSNKKFIISKVLGTKVTLSSYQISKATRCLRDGSTYQEGWEKNYDTHVTRTLYKENVDKAGDQETIMYNLLCEKAKIWTNILKNSVLHKVGSKTTLSVLHKFVLFHLMENLPFDLPHTIYINMLRNLKGLGGLDNIYYATLINKLLQDLGVYQVFNKMDDESKHTLVAKGLVVAKQPKFSQTNLKAMKVALEQNLKKAPQMDVDAINKRKQKRFAKAIIGEGRDLNSFGITRKIQKIMTELHMKKKTKK